MKVKIFNQIYDSETQPVMVILSDQDKQNIKNMYPECAKYASFPDGWTNESMLEWMEN